MTPVQPAVLARQNRHRAFQTTRNDCSLKLQRTRTTGNLTSAFSSSRISSSFHDARRCARSASSCRLAAIASASAAAAAVCFAICSSVTFCPIRIRFSCADVA